MRYTSTGAAVGALALVLAACGDDSGGDSGGDSGDGGYQIALIQGVQGDEFYISMQCGAEAAAEEAGAEVNTQGPAEFDAGLQTQIVDSVVASAPDAMLIAPTDVTAMERPIMAAIDAGIETVLVDTTLENPEGVVSEIASRCEEVESGARNIDHILTSTLLPQMSTEFLARMAEGKPIRAVTVQVADDKTFRFDVV